MKRCADIRAARKRITIHEYGLERISLKYAPYWERSPLNYANNIHGFIERGDQGLWYKSVNGSLKGDCLPELREALLAWMAWLNRNAYIFGHSVATMLEGSSRAADVALASVLSPGFGVRLDDLWLDESWGDGGMEHHLAHDAAWRSHLQRAGWAFLQSCGFEEEDDPPRLPRRTLGARLQLRRHDRLRRLRPERRRRRQIPRPHRHPPQRAPDGRRVCCGPVDTRRPVPRLRDQTDHQPHRHGDDSTGDGRPPGRYGALLMEVTQMRKIVIAAALLMLVIGIASCALFQTYEERAEAALLDLVERTNERVTGWCSEGYLPPVACSEWTELYAEFQTLLPQLEEKWAGIKDRIIAYIIKFLQNRFGGVIVAHYTGGKIRSEPPPYDEVRNMLNAAERAYNYQWLTEEDIAAIREAAPKGN